MTNKVIRQSSKRADFVAEKLKSLKESPNTKISKTYYKTYCLKCKKNKKLTNLDSKVLKTKIVAQYCHHQHVVSVAVKNQDL